MTVGQQLQAARKAQRLTIADAASAIRLRAGLVEAIEADKLELLGGDVYARGHLRSYARFLDLDVDKLLADYAEQSGVDAPAVEAAPEPTPAAARSLSLAPVASFADGARSLRPVMGHKRQANWTGAMIVALSLVLLVGVVAIIGKLGASPPKSSPIAQLPSLTASPSASASKTTSPTSTPSPSSTTPTVVPTDLVAQNPGATVQLAVSGAASWVSVVGNSKGTLFQGILQPGSTNSYSDRKGIKLVLGNAGAVSVTVNNNNLGVAGAQGQVVRMAFGPDGAPA
jgi:cytoskeletal protein RodZ